MAELLIKLAALLTKLRDSLNQVPRVSLYDTAKSLLAQHLTLDPAVPPELGCAEAISVVLYKSGIPVPTKGFPGTVGLYEYVKASPSFKLIPIPEPGALLISITKGDNHGHTGIFGKLGLQFPGDYGILSNNSDNGLFQEKWSWMAWQKHYEKSLGLQTVIFRAVDNTKSTG